MIRTGLKAPTFNELLKAIEHVVTNAAKKDSPSLDQLADELGKNKPQWLKTAARYRRLLLRDRRPRLCDVVAFEIKGKLQRVFLDDIFGRVIARVIERRLREILGPHLPEESVGLMKGTSLQRTMIAVTRYVANHPDDHVVVLDVAACFETIRPSDAVRALEDLGADPWTITWLRRFYRRNRGVVRGVGRGVAWAQMLSAVTLLPVVNRVRSCAKAMIWAGDDFLVFVEPWNAEKVWNELEAGLRNQGLRPSEKKTKKYVGAITGNWSFAGHVFDGGSAAPKAAAFIRLHEALRSNEKSKTGIINGWAGQYAGTSGSKEVRDASRAIKEEHGRDVQDLVAVMVKVAARAPAGAPLPGQQAGVYKEDSQIPSSQAGSYFPSPGEIQVGRSSAATPAARPPSRGAHAPTSSPETLLVQRLADPLVLRWEPERFPVLPPGVLMRLAFSSATDFMDIAESLEECLGFGRYQRLGFEAPDHFVEHHLGERLDVALLLIEVAAVARGFDWGANVDGDDNDPPIGLLRALLRMRSVKQWARDQRELLLALVAGGWMSIRAAKAAVHHSLRRGGQLVRTLSREERTRRKLQACLKLRVNDGRLLVLHGGGTAEWLPSDVFPRHRYQG